MKKAYIYLHNKSFELYLSDHELSPTELFCEALGEEYTSLGDYETEDAFVVGKLTSTRGDRADWIRCERTRFTTYASEARKKDV